MQYLLKKQASEKFIDEDIFFEKTQYSSYSKNNAKRLININL